MEFKKVNKNVHTFIITIIILDTRRSFIYFRNAPG